MLQPGPSQESSLLLTLEEISQLVSHSHHPVETLANIVGLIHRRFHTDVCSVYDFEPESSELILAATLGLKPESVGQVRMRLDEGLTGLAAQTLAPVMVEEAFAHPRFKFFPEAGEETYHSFLGVPLIEGGVLQGVLVVQTKDPRSFSLDEVRMLVAVAAQLAPLVSEAKLLEQVVSAAHEAASADATPAGPLAGMPLSPGAGTGRAYLVNSFTEWRQTVAKLAADSVHERQRLAEAMDGARAELTRLSQHISALVGEDHGAILQGQLMIMQDAAIEADLDGCLAAGASAEGALLQTLDKYVGAFQKLTNPFFQERVYDIKDVFRRILWFLRPGALRAGPSGERLVLVGHEASVMDLFSLDLDRLAGVAVEHGGPQTHVAILARSLGIPMVGQVPDLVSRVVSGQALRVDGTSGEIRFDSSIEEPIVALEAPTVPAARPPILAPGLPRIETNINLLCEVAPAVRQGTAGVGLFRSEFLFLARRTLPTEDEQVEIYRKLLHLLDGRPATVRTFDLRPDKMAHYPHLSSAAAHPLDWRLVLESPPLQKLFKDQVRAILRAAVDGPTRILVPLVTRTEQLDFVLGTIGAARDELRQDGLAFARELPMGVMVEVAAAIAMVDVWAEHVDFFALGTNDLAASVFGADRESSVGVTGGDPLHPGFLRLLRQTIEAAHRAGRKVTVCGEMAADPEGGPALAALGVDTLSVAVSQLGAVSRRLAECSVERLGQLGPKLANLRTSELVREVIRDAIQP
jgi:phosphotransferase system enzyme I (PtsP)